MSSMRQSTQSAAASDSTQQPLDVKIVQEQGSEDGSRVYSFSVDEHVKILIANMRQLWRHKEMTDVMLVSADKKTYRYHSVMLAACSTVFRDLLSGSQMQFYRGTLAPHDVSAKMLELLQDYLYRPDVYTQYQGDTDSLYQFAHYFGLEEMAVNGMLDTERFLENLGNLYSSRRLTFGILSAESVDFPCHYVIIASALPTLRPYLTQHEGGPDKLDNLYKPLPVDNTSPDVMKCLLDYIYYAQISIDERIVQDLFKTAVKMRVLSVAKACCAFIRSVVNISTVLSYRACAMKVQEIQEDKFCAELKNDMEKYTVDNFHLVIHEEAFNDVQSEAEIVNFLSRADLSQIEYSELIDAVRDWCYHSDERKTCLPGLLSLLAFLKEPKGLLRVIAQAEKQTKNQTLTMITSAFKGSSGAGKANKKKDQPPSKEDPSQRSSRPPEQKMAAQTQFTKEQWEAMLGPNSQLSQEQREALRQRLVQQQQQPQNKQ